MLDGAGEDPGEDAAAEARLLADEAALDGADGAPALGRRRLIAETEATGRAERRALKRFGQGCGVVVLNF